MGLFFKEKNNCLSLRNVRLVMATLSEYGEYWVMCICPIIFPVTYNYTTKQFMLSDDCQCTCLSVRTTVQSLQI